LAALEKEEAEQSELEKTKRKLHETEEKLKATEAKANIKLSVKEMLSEDKPIGVATPIDSRVNEDVDVEELKQEVLGLRGQVETGKETIENLNKKLAAVDKIREGFKELGLLPTAIPTEGQIGLQTTTTIVDVPAAEKFVTINTESMRGKILAVAKKGKLNSWRKLGEIVSAIQEEKWSADSAEVNNALNDLEKDGLIAKKHADRNYFCLAQGVKFKEALS
jgi:hypothetical protein